MEGNVYSTYEKKMQNSKETTNRIYFDLEIVDESVGRIVCELFVSSFPQTCNMFRQLCVKRCFVNTKVDKILRKEYIRGGFVPVEVFLENNISFVQDSSSERNLNHDKYGLLSLQFDDEQSSLRFCITTNASPSLDGKQVVVGQVIKGMSAVRKSEHVPYKQDTFEPKVDIRIVNCGALNDIEDDTVTPLISEDGDVFPHYVDDYSNEIKDRILASKQIRQIGNTYFKKGEYVKALQKYEKAFRYLSPGLCSFEETQELDKEEIIVLGNIAAAKLKKMEYSTVIEICSKILQMDSNNIKAMFRRGIASYHRGDYDQSKLDLQQAFNLISTQNTHEAEDILRWLNKTQQAICKYNAKDSQVYSKLFSS